MGSPHSISYSSPVFFLNYGTDGIWLQPAGVFCFYPPVFFPWIPTLITPKSCRVATPAQRLINALLVVFFDRRCLC